MKYLNWLVIVFFLGCAPGERSGDSLQKKQALPLEQGKQKESEPTGTQPFHKTRNNEKSCRINFDRENWVDVDIKLTQATVHNHVKEFKKLATFHLGTRQGKDIKSHDKLKEFCHAISHDKIPLEEISGRIAIFLNPLHRFILPRIALEYLHETVTSVKNPFIIAKKSIEIDADFLDQDEKNQIIREGSFERFDVVDHLKVPLFNPLFGPGPGLSSILARLFCGIADNKASILYTFHDEKGQEMRVRINGVVFEDLVY